MWIMQCPKIEGEVRYTSEGEMERGNHWESD